MILIVGGAGYIGSHINKQLHEQGVQTVVFDNFSTGHHELVKWGEVYEGDLRSMNDIRRCFERYSFEAVVHTAALSIVPDSVRQPIEYYHNNVVGTFNLLSVMKDYDVKSVVFSSTCAVYGDVKKMPITEETSCHPITPYGQTKRVIEMMLHDHHHAYGLRYMAFRYFNASGADPSAEIGEWHNPETHLIPLCLNAVLGKQPVLNIYGDDYDTEDGTCVRDFCHVNDIAMAHVLGINALKESDVSGCYNLGSGQGYSVKSVINTVSSVTGRLVRVVWGQRREGDVANLVADPVKIQSVLNWTPQYQSLDRIIGTAWQWHQALASIESKNA